MKPFKQAALALAMVGMLSAQAHASEAQVLGLQAAQPIAAFSQTDINALFVHSGQPMQLAALSQQEMKETEGAWVPMFLLGVRAMPLAMGVYHSSAYMPAYHLVTGMRQTWRRWR